MNAITYNPIIFTCFFCKQHFYKQARLKLAENQAKAKQYPETELLLFGTIRFLHSCYHPKIIGDILQNVQTTSMSVKMRLHN